MSSRFLVTGASGFIGKALVRRLQQDGSEVIELDRSYGNPEQAEFWFNLPSAHRVFHLAAKSYVPDSWTDPLAFVRSNVGLTAAVLEYCRRNNAALTFASAYVYGVPGLLPIAETLPAAPNNPYALTKLLAEDLCRFYADHWNLPVTILRIFNVYGPGQRPEFLIPSLIAQICRGDAEIRVKDLTPRRDYVFLDDVVDALIATDRAGRGYDLFNIGSGESYSVDEIVDIVQRLAGTRRPVVCEALPRANEIPDVQADISKARAALGWEPKYGLVDGVAKLLATESFK